ncbi:MAG TPA: methylmalonyl-CoA decarboxylase [Fibrobacteria bacterium]|nr:methylmalonyl-CoA decarboxylase [Fibrobacteria bacterium]HOX52073.1 methylmalonyl-CoA decarboxylase [Fibrobacteria bacterium]
MSLVKKEIVDSIGTLMMDNPAKRNVLSEGMIHEITDALAGFRQQQVRAVVLRATKGARTWSAGHDVNELPDRGRDPLSWNDPLRVLVRGIQDFPAPIIALLEGGVWGGACEAALACDILVATPETTFAITPAKLGIPYNLGGLLTLINAIPLPVVKEMLFTAQPIPSSQALNLGMINYVKSADEIEDFVMGIARQIAQNAPLSVTVMKEQLRLLSAAHAMSPNVFERVQGMRRIVYDSHDYQEGIDSFKEKRKPVYKGK